MPLLQRTTSIAARELHFKEHQKNTTTTTTKRRQADHGAMIYIYILKRYY